MTIVRIGVAAAVALLAMIALVGCEWPKSLTGPAGEQGEQGEQGEAGEPGEQGAAGADGTDGAVGERGEQGEAGEPGEQGAAGADGTDGAVGERGEQGPQGERGADALDATDGEMMVPPDIISVAKSVLPFFRGGAGALTYAVTAYPAVSSAHIVHLDMGIVTITPRAEDTGVTVFVVTATDEDGFTATARITVTVAQ